MRYAGPLTLTLLLGWTRIVGARCGAGDSAAVATVEAAVAARCECCGPVAAYKRCVQTVVAQAIRGKTLARACAPIVKRTAVTACPLVAATTQCKTCNADSDCASNQFCECRAGTCSKIGGTCVTKPRACPEYVKPVCGCDGTTFPNDCIREAAGACKAHDGACVTPTCQTDLDCDDGNFCTVDRCVNGQCEHDCICVEPASGSTCCGPGPLCVTTTTTTLPPTCTRDADCDDGDPCSADRCVNGVCEHACVCLAPNGASTCCPGPSALCVRPCGLDTAAGTCGGSCPTGATCESIRMTSAPACRCVSGLGGPCGGNIFPPPLVCAPGLVCQQVNPDATGVCVAANCVPFAQSGCTQTSDCCEPCTLLQRAPCAVCILGVCSPTP